MQHSETSSWSQFHESVEGASPLLPSWSQSHEGNATLAHTLCVSTPPVALAAQWSGLDQRHQSSANEWLAGRHDAHLPSHQRLASPLLGTWRSRRWLASSAPPPALLAPRRHAGARAWAFPLVATYAPAASCGLPPINGAGVELFAGFGSMSSCWAHYGFPVAGLAENAASMQRTIRRRFPDSVVIHDANSVNAAALQPPSSSDSDSDSENQRWFRHSDSDHPAPPPVRPPVKVASVYGGIPCQPIAPSGAARGIDDPRIGDTTDALPRATRALDANSADAENHANIVTINGGAVLA